MQPVILAPALVALALVAAPAVADPVTPRTITGYSAAAAAQQGRPLEVPQGEGPMQDGAPVAAQAGAGGQSVAAGGQADPAAAPAAPRKVRYGLFGFSWRSE